MTNMFNRYRQPSLMEIINGRIIPGNNINDIMNLNALNTNASNNFAAAGPLPSELTPSVKPQDQTIYGQKRARPGIGALSNALLGLGTSLLANKPVGESLAQGAMGAVQGLQGGRQYNAAFDKALQESDIRKQQAQQLAKLYGVPISETPGYMSEEAYKGTVDPIQKRYEIQQAERKLNLEHPTYNTESTRNSLKLAGVPEDVVNSIPANTEFTGEMLKSIMSNYPKISMLDTNKANIESKTDVNKSRKILLDKQGNMYDELTGAKINFYNSGGDLRGQQFGLNQDKFGLDQQQFAAQDAARNAEIKRKEKDSLVKQINDASKTLVDFQKMDIPDKQQIGIIKENLKSLRDQYQSLYGNLPVQKQAPKKRQVVVENVDPKTNKPINKKVVNPQQKSNKKVTNKNLW